MYKDTYKRIEREYESKRNLANQNFQKLKENTYNNNPRLKEIDLEISKLGIKAVRLSITSDKSQSCKDLENQIAKLKKEREQILSKLNIELVPKYSCTKCNDTGYIYENGTSQMCSCFKQELINESYSKSNLYKLKEESFDKVNLNLFSNEVNKDYQISPRANMEKIIKIAKDFIDNFEDPSQKNLLFTGTPRSR